MKYLSVCAGIEAASVAWHCLGWEPLALSEIDAFPRAVLAHHYPGVPLHGDFTKLRDDPWIVDADVLVGGTPCQAFSVAGLRRSLDDDRGNLSLEFVRLADAIDDFRLDAGKQPAIVVWENVPGVLSVKDNAFGCFLSALAGEDTAVNPPRGKWTDAGVVDGPRRRIAWRILDAQYFGLAQRRRRVFVVASAREGFDPAAVLLEQDCLRWNPPTRGQASEGASTGIEIGPSGGRFTDLNPTLDARAKDGPIRNQIAGAVLTRDWPAEIAPTLNAHFGEKQGLEDQHIGGGRGCSFPAISRCLNAGGMGRQDWETETLIATTGGVFDVKPITFGAQMSAPQVDHDLVQTLQAKNPMAVTYPINTQIALRHNALGERTGMGIGDVNDPGFTLQAGHSHAVAVAGAICRDSFTGGAGGRPEGAAAGHFVPQNMAVRRLTPRECEALQGFPPNYTAIPWRRKPAADCPDGPRYKALGNSMAVPVMRWIGNRIAQHLKEVE